MLWHTDAQSPVPFPCFPWISYRSCCCRGHWIHGHCRTVKAADCQNFGGEFCIQRQNSSLRTLFFFFSKLLIYNARNMRQKHIQPRLSISLDSPWVLGAPTVLYNTHVMLSVSAICLWQWAGKKKKWKERRSKSVLGAVHYRNTLVFWFQMETLVARLPSLITILAD